MQIKFTATAIKPDYVSLEDIVSGKDKPMITCSNTDYWTQQGYVAIGQAEVTVTLRSEDQIVAGQIAALRAQLQAVRAENQRKENAILEQISKLQAITYVGAEVAG